MLLDDSHKNDTSHTLLTEHDCNWEKNTTSFLQSGYIVIQKNNGFVAANFHANVVIMNISHSWHVGRNSASLQFIPKQATRILFEIVCVQEDGATQLL